MDLPSAKIAVVDDDEDSLNLFTEVISMNGYIVIGFSNPYFLLDYISEHDQIKFILLDYKLPEMNGCELANIIHELKPSIGMAFITASNDVINNALDLEIIKKPISISKIVEIINNYMENHLIL